MESDGEGSERGQLYEQLQHDNHYDKEQEEKKKRTCLQKTFSLYPFLLVGGFPVSVVLTLCGTYIVYCVRYAISVLEFASAMTGIGLGLGLFTAFLSMCCVHWSRKESTKGGASSSSSVKKNPVTDIEMQVADMYENEQ